jgi:hypothetical protein
MTKTFFRNAILASVLAIPTMALVAEGALADKSNFVVENTSSYTVTELYISSSDVDSWGGNILGNDPLEPGESMRIEFEDPSNQRCLYDIRFVTADGQVQEDYQGDVCQNDAYTISESAQ